MLIIGLTGGIGSGKSAASALFSQHDIDVVDADIVAREVVEPGTPALKQISQHFGPKLINKDGTLDRGQLRDIIFSTPDERNWLEQLLHPMIREEILCQLGDVKSPYAILVSPLLFETNQHELVTRSLLIDIPVELQIERASNRDNTAKNQIKKIIASQLSRECKIARASDIICNDQDLAHLEREVKKQHLRYLELADAQ